MSQDIPLSHRSLRLLLVECDLSAHVQLRRFLESAGLEVFSAIDGRAGLYMATAYTFDAIILPATLPDFDDYALSRASGERHGSTRPVLIVFGATDSEAPGCTGTGTAFCHSVAGSAFDKNIGQAILRILTQELS